MSRTLLTINDLTWSGFYSLPSNGTATSGGPGTTSYSSGALAVRYVSGERRFLMPTYCDQNNTTGQTWGDMVEWRVPATAPYTGATPSAAPAMVEVRRWANWAAPFATNPQWWSGNGVRVGGIYWDDAQGVLWYELYGYYDSHNHPFLAAVQLLDTTVTGNYRAVGSSYGPWWYRDGNPADTTNTYWKQACNWIVAVPADQQTALNNRKIIVGAGVGAIGGAGNIGTGFHAIDSLPPLTDPPNTVIPLGQRLADYSPESTQSGLLRAEQRTANYTFDFNPNNQSGLQPVAGGIGRWQMSLDQVNSFIWVETTTKEGILLFGRQSQGYTWYGFNPRSVSPGYNPVGPDESDPTRNVPESGNGYGSSVWGSALYIFDPAQVREVAAGTRSPYSNGINATSSDWRAQWPNLPLSTYEQANLGTAQSRPIASIVSNGGFWDAVAQEIIWVNPTVIGGARPVLNLFTIGASAPPLIITTGALASGVQGTAYSQALNGSNGTLPYSWGATGLPTGLSVVGSNITGTPSANGTFSVALTLTDAVAATAHATLPMVIAASTPAPLPLLIQTVSLASGTVGSVYTTPLVANQGTPTYTWGASGLHAGLAVVGATIAGTPTVSGTNSVTITVTDSGSPTPQITNKVLPLTIAALPLPTITTTSLASGVQGTSYTQALTGSSGVAPYTWSASGLPSGLSVSGANITGTPTANGTFNVAITLTDNVAATAQTTLPLVIAPVVPPPPPLVITTSSPLPAGIVGTAYTTTLVSANGTGPFTWSVSSGLPPGLTMSVATIAGTPTVPGVYLFTVMVTDSTLPTPHTATTTFSLTVTAVQPPPTPTTVQSAVATPVQWSLKVQDVPPDDLGGWAVQFYKSQGVKLSTKATAPPYVRSVLVNAGTYRPYGVWTKTGQPTVTRNPMLVVVDVVPVITPPDSTTIQSVTVTPVKWNLVITDVPPDAAGGWTVQFYRNPGLKVGKSDNTSPYTRSAVITAGTYAITGVWTKSGQQTVTRDDLVKVLP